VTGSQFASILKSIQEVRTEIAARLDTIDERLRDVEVDLAKATTAEEISKEAGIAVRWKVGILVSAVGIIVSLVMKILEAL
jgi:tetrahydromethanopterin S-methyltransferase subunit G